MQAVELTAAALFDYLGIEAASRIRVEKHEGGTVTITPLRPEDQKVDARAVRNCMDCDIPISDEDIERMLEGGQVGEDIDHLRDIDHVWYKKYGTYSYTYYIQNIKKASPKRRLSALFDLWEHMWNRRLDEKTSVQIKNLLVALYPALNYRERQMAKNIMRNLACEHPEICVMLFDRLERTYRIFWEMTCALDELRIDVSQCQGVFDENHKGFLDGNWEGALEEVRQLLKNGGSRYA